VERGSGAALRILGIDPGSSATGFGVIEWAGGRIVHVVHGTIRPGRGDNLAARLHSASVEKVFVATNPRSALVLGQARGAALVALGHAGLPIHEYAPTQIKQTVAGSGRAAKREVQRAVRRLLSLDQRPAADAADALAAALRHAHAGRLGALGVTQRGRPRARREPAIRVRRAP